MYGEDVYLHRRLRFSGRVVEVRFDADDDWYPNSLDPNPDGGATLIVDGRVRGHLFTRYQSRLKAGAAQRIAVVIERALPLGVPMTVLHVGAGALALARHITLTRPDSRQYLIESDAELLQFVIELWPPAQTPQHIGTTLQLSLEAAALHAPYDFVIIDLVADPHALIGAHGFDVRSPEFFLDVAPLLGGKGKLVIA